MRPGPAHSFATVFGGAALALSLLAGCGGGGGSSSVPSGGSGASSQSNPQPVSSPTTGPVGFTASNTVSVSTTSGPVTVPLPSAAGFSGQATLPVTNVPSGTQLTQTLTSSAPSGIPALSRLRRGSASFRFVRDAQTQPLLYLCFTSNAGFTLSGDPTFLIALPSNASATASYYLAFFDGSSWSMDYAGPASPSGGDVQLTGSSPITFNAQVQECVALYQSSSTISATATPTVAPTAAPTAASSSPAVPTPTPTPTSSPTPSPSPSSSGGGNVGIHLAIPTPAPILATQSSLIFSGIGQQTTVYLSEAGYSGSFSATTTNSAVATATVGIGVGNNPTLTVTSTGFGTCTINLSSSNQGSGAVSILVQ